MWSDVDTKPFWTTITTWCHLFNHFQNSFSVVMGRYILRMQCNVVVTVVTMVIVVHVRGSGLAVWPTLWLPIVVASVIEFRTLDSKYLANTICSHCAHIFINSQSEAGPGRPKGHVVHLTSAQNSIMQDIWPSNTLVLSAFWTDEYHEPLLLNLLLKWYMFHPPPSADVICT